MLIGAVLAAAGVVFYDTIFNCIVDLTACSPTRALTSLEIGLAFTFFGGALFFAGTMFVVAGHLTEHLRSERP